MGVPTLGCDCAVCTSADPHDRRLRPSVLLRWREPGQAQRARGGHRHRPRLPRAGAAQRAHARGRGLLHARARRPHLGMDDLRPLSFIASAKAAPSRSMPPGDGAGAGAHLRLHFFARATYPTARAWNWSRWLSALRFTASIPARSAAAWRDGDCRLSLWPRRLSDRRERHSRIELCAA
jgi:hypothetical protein